MSAILYPVAANADSALARPLGRVARESEAGALAGGPVTFVTEPAGPAFDTEDAAMAAWSGRIDDPFKGRTVQPSDRYCALREMVAPTAGRKPKSRPMKPVYRDGRRWPQPSAPPATLWRLSVSYWRVVGAEEQAQIEKVRSDQARHARRQAASETLDAAALRAMIHRPLRAFRPQQPLDVGLFEVPLPEAPHLMMPDE